MNKKLLLVVATLWFPFGLYAQQTAQPWELPVNKGLVFYKDATTIPVSKNELCSYFYTQSFYDTVIEKLDSITSQMAETKFLKGTMRYSYVLQLNTGEEPGQSKMIACNPEQNDTIFGHLKYYIDWSSLSYTNGKQATRNITVDFFVTIIFMNREDIYLSLKGLSVKEEEFHPGTGKTQYKDENLADAYQKFIDAKEKSDDDKKLFSNISELSRAFYPTFFNTLKREVKLHDE